MCHPVCVCAVQALLLKGEVFEGMRSYKDASDTYRRALATHPGHRDLENALHRVQSKQSQWANKSSALLLLYRNTFVIKYSVGFH